MGRRLGIGGPAAALVAILSWRLVAEVLERRRALAATGELDRRVAARRAAAIDGAVRAAASTAVHVAQVESATKSSAMERALAMNSRERGETLAPTSNSWIWSAVLALSLVGAVAGTALTALALIDPLAEASPLRAGVGVVAVLAAWFGARASSRRRDV